MSAAIDYDTHRFGIAHGASDLCWHAVDLEVTGPPWVAAMAENRVDVFSVCGTRSQLVRKLGPFTYESRWLKHRRCERCGWVVALNRGTVEQETELYTADGGGRAAIVAVGGDPDLLRQIFIAILADAPPGRDGAAGHRSDLLAHAARHRPTVSVCADCSESASAADVHGADAARCPHAALLCAECIFTTGPWAAREGIPTGECVVGAPCSVLTTLTQHYGIPASPGGQR